MTYWDEVSRERVAMVSSLTEGHIDEKEFLTKYKKIIQKYIDREKQEE